MAFAQTLLRKMLSDSVTERHYDVFFLVQSRKRDGTVSETRLGAHRVVLSAVSDKFEQICSSSVSSKNEIPIQECSAAAVREALEIIYGGELRESKTSILLALDIWRFGVLFQVDHLMHLARGTCLQNLSTDNCLRILDFAVHVGDIQIVDKLQNYAAENANFSHVITSPYFNLLDFKVISSLVRPGKGECAWPEILTFEKVWFDALVKWLASRISINDGLQQDKESIALIEKTLALADFSRMKTHELRDVSKNEIALKARSFSSNLVSVLLTRSEQLESSILERSIDLDAIGQKYQQALGDQDEAERRVRAAVEKLENLQMAKKDNKRYDELGRKKIASKGGAVSTPPRRKVSGDSTII